MRDDFQQFLPKKYYHEDDAAFATSRNTTLATYNPRNVPLISGALREARLVGGYNEATDIYVAFWDEVVNIMQLAEDMATGETGNDSFEVTS